MNLRRGARGFTLLEIVIGMLIVAVLSVAAVMLYNNYTSRAQGTDIVLKYDAIRGAVGTALAQGQGGYCGELMTRIGDANLEDKYAQLAYGFEGVQGGYRPVLTICATVEKNGVTGVKTARGAHDTLARNGRVEKGAVLTDTLVSFALPLTDSANSVCIGQPPRVASTCAHPLACRPGTEKVTVQANDGSSRELCLTLCAPGTVRNPNPRLPNCINAAAPVAPAQAAAPAAQGAGPAPAPAPAPAAAAQPKSQADCQPNQQFWRGGCLNLCNPGWYLYREADGMLKCSSTPPPPDKLLR